MEANITEDFKKIDASVFPDFYNYKMPLERGLWVLWVAKEKLGIKKLSAEQIVSVIREVKEISIDAKSIIKAFNRAGDKIHPYPEDKDIYFFEIMKPGKDHLLSQVKQGFIELFYFEPDKRYTSKRILSKEILDVLKGELKIVDPYCNERTLDILKDVKDRQIKILTRVENLKEKERHRFLRELRDFISENENVEFKTYPRTDIHDRYIISSDFLVILGHSIKDLGSKESFAVLLDRKTCKNIVEALIENFNRRWKQANYLQ